NLLLAAVPFILLFAAGLGYLLNQSSDASSVEINALVDRFLPPHPTGQSPLAKVLVDIIKSRQAIGLYSIIGFIWFSTRLFGSLRSVLCAIFDIDSDRGIIAGKLFDVQITVVSSLLLVAYTALNAYMALATTKGLVVLGQIGVRKDVMGTLEYNLGQLVAFIFISLMFFSLYKYLPNRKIRWQTAFIASMFTSILLEVAKRVFGLYVSRFNPGSLYTGTLAALVILVIWLYYAATIFILGGEVAQVYELRRVRRLQREAFED
ncbi:MAG: YihY/virulence factor BrkB family protein, partial [Gemmatimonadaceae bacterium]